MKVHKPRDLARKGEPKMKISPKTIAGLVVAISFLATSHAMARDTRHMFSLAEALNTPDAVQRVTGDVKMIFGHRPHPAVARTFGTFTSNKKTNAFNKSDKGACEWVFLSAILSLQDRARKEGGDAVINIHSYYKKQPIWSQTQYMCSAGTFVAGVALRGTVVKLK
jgi:hypothetical protein